MSLAFVPDRHGETVRGARVTEHTASCRTEHLLSIHCVLGLCEVAEVSQWKHLEGDLKKMSEDTSAADTFGKSLVRGSEEQSAACGVTSLST